MPMRPCEARWMHRHHHPDQISGKVLHPIGAAHLRDPVKLQHEGMVRARQHRPHRFGGQEVRPGMGQAGHRAAKRLADSPLRRPAPAPCGQAALQRLPFEPVRLAGARIAAG